MHLQVVLLFLFSFCVNGTIEMEVCFSALYRVNVGDQNIRVSMNIPPGYLGYGNFGMGKGVSTGVRSFIQKNPSWKTHVFDRTTFIMFQLWQQRFKNHVFTVLFTKRPAWRLRGFDWYHSGGMEKIPKAVNRRTVFEESSCRRQNACIFLWIALLMLFGDIDLFPCCVTQ